MSVFLGIARERIYSPGKQADDRAILDAVAERLRARHRVALVSADDPLPEIAPGTVVFAMCQGPRALGMLQRWEAEGVRVVNSSAAIWNCRRTRMLAALDRHQVRHPPSVTVSAEPEARLPGWLGAGAWIKRGDVHATAPGDVVLVRDRAAAREVLGAFRRRGIAGAVVQRHVSGDVFKFYAVRGGFFRCFAASGGSAGGKGWAAAMATLAAQGGAAAGLDIFGGDCVRDEHGGLWLVDLNDWPSYAACRAAAADAIAAYLLNLAEHGDRTGRG